MAHRFQSPVDASLVKDFIEQQWDAFLVHLGEDLAEDDAEVLAASIMDDLEKMSQENY